MLIQTVVNMVNSKNILHFLSKRLAKIIIPLDYPCPSHWHRKSMSVSQEVNSTDYTLNPE